MCKDKEQSLKDDIKDAIRNGLPETIIDDLRKELWELTGEPFYNPDIDPAKADDSEEGKEWDLPDYYHADANQHPPMLIFSSLNPPIPHFAEWGFVPNWVKSWQDAYSGWGSSSNNFTNITSEKFFTDPKFQKTALRGLCVLKLNSYYESHHYKRKTYPFRIFMKDQKPFYVAAAWRRVSLPDEKNGEVITKNTFASLTCRANEKMARIHNNPKMLAKNGHRMLVIIPEELLDEFLKPYDGSEDQNDKRIYLQKKLGLCQPYDQNLIDFHSVINLTDRPAQGLPYIGNVPEITKPYRWKDFDYSRVEEPISLF